MIKFVSHLDKGNLYGFGLTKDNLNRMEFNNEPLFFDFGYAGQPDLFGLILYLPEFEKPEDVNVKAVAQYCIPFFNLDRGVLPETLRVFPMVQSVIQQFRSVPYWALETKVEITNQHDIQMFFAGRDEQDIEEYFQRAGFLTAKTKRTTKGFGNTQ
jgi:hypothetical protein